MPIAIALPTRADSKCFACMEILRSFQIHGCTERTGSPQLKSDIAIEIFYKQHLCCRAPLHQDGPQSISGRLAACGLARAAVRAVARHRLRRTGVADEPRRR